jgi:cyclopropane-fatty-acyl-phospholipid synthase
MATMLRSMMRYAIREGSLDVVTFDKGCFRVGDGRGRPIKVRFTDAAGQRAVVRNPELAFGELYMQGRFVVEQGSIADFLDIVLRNLHGRPYPMTSRSMARARKLLRKWKQLNRGERSKQNVAHHYDLDARLYDLFLDGDKQYSCAYFEHPGQGLEEAQLAKKRHISAKLSIEPGHRVLDIGCGWGGLGLYLAEVAGADVTGITLSEEQLAIARRRAEEHQLSRQADFRLEDYRRITGTYDRIVSVGMFEHVGVGFYDTYFQHCARLLNDDGVMLMHTIGRVEGPSANNPWMEKYIFPGGYIPSMSEMTAAVERSGLIITDIEVLRLHYAETLKAWRERFMARRQEAAALYDEAFVRMWEFYLAGCEASFRCGDLVVFQVQLVKKVEVLPITRGYIALRETDLRSREAAPLRLAGE